MSGDIDREEFKPVYKSLIKAGYKLGELDQAIATLDESGDGKVSLNEYISWLVRIGSLPL